MRERVLTPCICHVFIRWMKMTDSNGFTTTILALPCLACIHHHLSSSCRDEYSYLYCQMLPACNMLLFSDSSQSFRVSQRRPHFEACVAWCPQCELCGLKCIFVCTCVNARINFDEGVEYVYVHFCECACCDCCPPTANPHMSWFFDRLRSDTCRVSPDPPDPPTDVM